MAHIDCSFYSPALEKNAHVIVYLPTVSADDYLEDRPIAAEYNRPEKRWPTLYLLHGSYGDCMDWCLRTGIERYAQEKGIAVVMPSGENSSYINMAHGERYLDYIGKELVEFTRKMFPLSRARGETYIAGLSMGGYGAYRVAFEFPETFGKAASLSGGLDMQMLQNIPVSPHMTKMDPHYVEAVFADRRRIEGTRDDLLTLLGEQIAAGKTLPELYMTCGTEDFIYPANEKFYAGAQALGVPVTYEKFHGIHNWDFWDAHIQDVLRWLF